MGSLQVSTTGKFSLDSKYVGLQRNIRILLNRLIDEIGDCVNLGQGFPDYQPAPQILQYLANICKPDLDFNRLHQYTRGDGHPRLVKAIAAMYSKLIGKSIDPWTEVIVTGGAHGALFYTIMSNVGKNDEVIIMEPFFDCYEPMVRLAGGTPVFIPLKSTLTPMLTSNGSASHHEALDETTAPSLRSSSQWTLDMNELDSLFNDKTKALIVNSPNNPLGKVFSMEELTAIAQLCIKHDVLVISDEVYEWIVYEGEKHIRIASLPGMWERTVTIGSAGKTFSLTGWKLGWAYGPSCLIHNLQIAHQTCTYMCQTPEQEAVAVALENELPLVGTEKSFFHQMQMDLINKRKLLTQAISMAGMIPIIPQGGYFILANWSPLRYKIQGELDKLNGTYAMSLEDVKFVTWLAKQKLLLGIPPSTFYSNKNKYIAGDFIRFNFYKRDDTLRKASTILQTLKSLPQ